MSLKLAFCTSNGYTRSSLGILPGSVQAYHVQSAELYLEMNSSRDCFYANEEREVITKSLRRVESYIDLHLVVNLQGRIQKY